MAIFSADKNVNVISWDLINNMSADSCLLFLQNDTNNIYFNIIKYLKLNIRGFLVQKRKQPFLIAF